MKSISGGPKICHMLQYKNEWGSPRLWKDRSVVKRQARKKKNQFTEYKKKMLQIGKLLKDKDCFRMWSNCPAVGLAHGEGLFYRSPFVG